MSMAPVKVPVVSKNPLPNFCSNDVLLYLLLSLESCVLGYLEVEGLDAIAKMASKGAERATSKIKVILKC
ncbi:hypothetical protein PM082_013680 [Marasmius tenuissimus]|nr:hypothetical protein PM082_013680 [Marasmius tenuissimus]